MSYSLNARNGITFGATLMAQGGLSRSFCFNDQSNTDVQKFLTDWKAGVEVLNADGSPAPYSDAAVIALGLTP